jgi:transketolase C-terminal domain/subunit
MDNSKVHPSQRGYFAEALFNEMLKDDRIYLVTGDLGYIQFDEIKKRFPNRFINVGAAEQAGVMICVGLAQAGMKPFFYTITSFLLRAAETIHLYLDTEQCPVSLVGAGRDNDYLADGKSHWGYAAQQFIAERDIETYYPQEKEDVPNFIKLMVENDSPSFISLRR